MDKKEEAKKFYAAYGAKPLSPWEGATKQQTFRCEAMLDGSKCGCEFNLSFSRGKNLLKRWIEKLPEHNLHGVMCPNHRKLFSKTRTKHYFYENMSDLELYKLALKSKEKNKYKKHYDNSVHYNEMVKRKNSLGLSMVDRLNEHFGQRRQRPELKNYKLDDWRAYHLEHKFFSKSRWKKLDPYAQMLCYKNGFMEQLTEEFFSTRMLFKSHTGKVIQCQSNAELIFIKVLDELRLDFQAHPLWPFWYKNEAYKCKADFSIMFDGKLIFLEVWMLRKDLVSQGDLSGKFVQDYLQRRKYKEEKIIKCADYTYDIFASVEARTLKKNGLEAYLIEVKDNLKSLGIKNTEKITPELFDDLEKLIFKADLLEVEELIRYAKLNNFSYFTQFDNTLERLIRKNPPLQEKLEIALAKEFHRVPNSRFFDTPPLDDIIAFVSARNELHSKESYITAHSNGQLPSGFMAIPINSYPELKSWRQLWGEPQLVNFSDAKNIVRLLNVKGKTDFTNRRAKVKKSLNKNSPDFDLLKVRSNPGNKMSGGYEEFTTWREFTDSVDAAQLQNRKNGINHYTLLVKEGDISKITDELSKLNYSSPTELRKIIGSNAYSFLTKLKSIAFIELMLFDKTTKPIKDLNKLVNYVPEYAYENEKKWHELRKKNIIFRLFPAKLDRNVKLGKTVGWTEVKNILKNKSENLLPVESWFSSSMRLLKQKKS